VTPGVAASFFEPHIRLEMGSVASPPPPRPGQPAKAGAIPKVREQADKRGNGGREPGGGESRERATSPLRLDSLSPSTLEPDPPLADHPARSTTSCCLAPRPQPSLARTCLTRCSANAAYRPQCSDIPAARRCRRQLAAWNARAGAHTRRFITPSRACEGSEMRGGGRRRTVENENCCLGWVRWKPSARVDP
jgi:hypothetical protein